ncbi:MAG: hypothetical protein K2K32_03315, partial [Muribaculaceae bacterium]|nr:hypothetical protein [Muribaculaceae bacterium]
ITHPYIETLVASQIEEFFDREFASYSEKELKEEGIGFVGSVADELSDALTKELQNRNWKLRAIVRKPLAGIVSQFK